MVEMKNPQAYEDLKSMAMDWINSWNTRNIEGIMSHYTDEIEFYAPTVIKRWNIPDGKLTGKEQLKKHFLKGFELAPDLYFEFIDLLLGTDGITIIYKRETGVMVADVVVLDQFNKAKIAKAYYGQ